MTYKTRHGVDWPAEMCDAFIDMTVAKKWRQFKAEYGIEFKDPWVPLLDAAKALIPEQYFRVPPWTEEHFHDWVMAEKGCITWGPGACGKALLPSEPVYYSGHVSEIGNVRPGDEIFSATGNLVRVRGVYRQLDMPLYRVRFTDGTETICAKDHLWTVRYFGRVRWDGPRSSRRAVRGWITKTLPVEKLASWTTMRHRSVSIPLTAPLAFASQPVPLDPYVLGVLIGDASMTSTVLLASHEADKELRDEVDRRLQKEFPDYGLVRVHGSKTAYMVVHRAGQRPRNPVNRALRDLGLYGHVANSKFVPECYKMNSVSVRMDVLAGLFDTDGTVSKSGHVTFTTVSRQLAQDVKFMLGSLGIPATVTEKHTAGQLAYNVYLREADPNIVRQLFKLTRKADRVKTTLRRGRAGRRNIESVELVQNRQDYPRETVCITIEDTDAQGNPTEGLFPVGDFVVTHNSNDYGLLMLLDWVTDPFDTVIRLGSTDKQSLKSRSWNAVVTYFAALRQNKLGLAIPGKFSKSGYAILNDDADDSPESVGEKAGIVGVAVNDSEDSGKLQGAHAKYVRLVIDELATITHHDNIRKAMQNLRIGAIDFRFFALANPASWEDESCQYCVPPGGVSSVSVDDTLWTSTRGFLVRHHDGHKCITVERPETAKEYPFLITREVIAQNLSDCDGNTDAPIYWQMVRGFPVPSSTGAPVILDHAIATQQHVTDRVEFRPETLLATVAGCDPAWSENGDGACYARCYIRLDPFGRPYLDFTDGLRKLAIKAQLVATIPVTQQLANQVVALAREPYAAPFDYLAVDASANQGLADHLRIFAGANPLAVNNSVRASEAPLRANESEKTCDTIYDRGTESWCVLAEFCRAGMVRGLPAEALRGLVTRRYAMRKNTQTQMFPLRLEPKDEFKARFKKSPDETDACALAALAAKERYGLMPFGYVTQTPTPASLAQEQAPAGPVIQVADYDGYGTIPEDGDDFGATDAG